VVIDIITSSEPGIVSFKDQGLLVALEESLELVGVSLVIYALIDYLERNYRKKIIETLNTFKS
jgi:hypothetical protein